MDLGSMSVADLRRLQTRVGAEIQRRNDSAKKIALKRMKKVAEEEGLSFDDVINEITAGAGSTTVSRPARRGRKPAAAKPLGKTSAPSKGIKVPPKYFHPENPKINWSGRGRKPQWVVDWLAQNKPLAELENPAS